MQRAEFIARAMIALRAQPQPMGIQVENERGRYTTQIEWYERTPEECLTEAKKLWKAFRTELSASDD